MNNNDSAELAKVKSIFSTYAKGKKEAVVARLKTLQDAMDHELNEVNRPTFGGTYLLLELKPYKGEHMRAGEYDKILIEKAAIGTVIQDGYKGEPDGYELVEARDANLRITKEHPEGEPRKARIPDIHLIEMQTYGGKREQFYHNCLAFEIRGHNEEREDDINKLYRLKNEYKYNQFIFSDDIISKIMELIKKLK